MRIGFLVFFLALGLGENSKIEKLRELKRDSRLIKMTGKMFNEYALVDDKDYILVVLFITQKKDSKVIEWLLDEYLEVIKAFSDTKDLFFSLVEYNKETDPLFRSLEMTQSCLLLIKDQSISVNNEDISYNPLDLHKIDKTGSVNMLRFLNYRLGTNAEIQVSVWRLILNHSVTVVLLVGLFSLVYRSREYLQDRDFWFISSLIIYYICISGFVYDILKEPGFVGRNDKGQLQLISPRQKTQYIIEGFTMAFLLCLSGISLLCIHLTRLIADDWNLRLAASVLIFVFFFCLSLVRKVYTIKTGWYHPSFDPPPHYLKGSLYTNQGFYVYRDEYFEEGDVDPNGIY